MLTTSGLIGLGPDDQMAECIEDQIELIFGQGHAILESAGGDFADVVAIDSYHTGVIALHDQMEKFMAVRNRFIRHKPIWTALGVSSLAIPGSFIEVKFTACLAG